MNCEMQGCNKSIQEGRLICILAVQKTPMGNKKVNLLVVICEECIKAQSLEDRAMGGVKILDPYVLNPQEGL